MATSDATGTDTNLKEVAVTEASADQPPPPYQASYGATNPVPPTYNQTQYPDEPPPSYESVYGQVRAAKQESNSAAEFFKKFLVIVLGTLGCTIFIGLILAIPVSMIVIGSMYLYDCTIEKYIPIYLIVGGCFGVVKNLSNVLQRVKNRHNDQDEDNSKTNPIDGTLNCFLVVWFIAGNVWIYRVYGDVNYTDPSSPNYCHPTLYLFAFWVTTSAYILAALVCCCICCAGVMAGLVNSGKDDNQQNAA